jgi:hypothetical protein
VASLAGVDLDGPTKAWVQGRDGTNELLGKGGIGPRAIPLTWDYRFSMPGELYHHVSLALLLRREELLEPWFVMNSMIECLHPSARLPLKGADARMLCLCTHVSHCVFAHGSVTDAT